MTARSKYRGHSIVWKAKHWQYEDGEPTTSERPCVHCGRISRSGDPDPCLGKLPRVKAACCGHGEPDDAYMIFDCGASVYGSEVHDLINCWRRYAVRPGTVIDLYLLLWCDIDLTREFCRMSNNGYSRDYLIDAAMIFNGLLLAGFDFSKVSAILEVYKQDKRSKSLPKLTSLNKEKT